MTPNMLALRVPCDARMSRRDAELAALRQTHPEISGPSCASRRAWTGDLWSKPKTQDKDQGPKRNQLSIVIPAFAGMTEEKLVCL